MLRMFSNIRNQLLGEGKLLRYISYAIGEILLIIIGILFALQINNWNESRKDRQAELSILEEIYDNLQGDLRIFNRAINQLNDADISCERLLGIVDKDLPYDEHYGYYLTYLSIYPRFDSNTSGYQLLKTKGLELISDNELRKSLTHLYEIRYEAITSMEEDAKGSRINDVRSALKNYQSTRLLTGEGIPGGLTINEQAMGYGLYRPMINFDAFKKDTDFHWVIRDIATTTRSELARYERNKRAVVELVAQLEDFVN